MMQVMGRAARLFGTGLLLAAFIAPTQSHDDGSWAACSVSLEDSDRLPDQIPWTVLFDPSCKRHMAPVSSGFSADPSSRTSAPRTPWPAPCETFAGHVMAGESYQQPFGDGLLFRLRSVSGAPSDRDGWTIEVRAGPDGEHDLVYPATPPYRFSGMLHIGAVYGLTAQQSARWEQRTFGFVTSEEAYAPLSEAVRFLISSRTPEMTTAQYEAAYDSVYSAWEAMMRRVGKGRLRITDVRVSDPTPEHPGGQIEHLAFIVTLCPDGEEPPDALGSGAGPFPRDSST